MTEGIPQEFTREQFEEKGISVTDGEVRAVNHYVYELERAFRGEGPLSFVVEDGGEDYDPDRMPMLMDFARNFLRQEPKEDA